MPAGPSALGFVYFAATKLLGYTAFCRWGIQPQVEYAMAPQDHAVQRELFSPAKVHNRIPSAWKAGAVRTGIGVAIGAVVGLAFWRIPYFATHDFFDNGVFFALLVPVRVFEWWLLLHWIYNGFALNRKTFSVLLLTGILVSFGLDAAGVFLAFVIPGGMWVC